MIFCIAVPFSYSFVFFLNRAARCNDPKRGDQNVFGNSSKKFASLSHEAPDHGRTKASQLFSQSLAFRDLTPQDSNREGRDCVPTK
jgi:hypothetical protein